MKRVVVVVAGLVVGVGAPDVAGTSRRPRVENDAGFEAVTSIKATGFAKSGRSIRREDRSGGGDHRFHAELASIWRRPGRGCTLAGRGASHGTGHDRTG
jgi:hypothetical protein